MSVVCVDHEIETRRDLNGGNSKTGGFFTTYTGKNFNPITPTIDTINIQDIANALSNICRFGGHCNQFYSVAQHSVFVSTLCDDEDALIGLLHDASEAYIGDMVRPLKYTDAMTPFREVENHISDLIVKKFSLKSHMTKSVKDADNLMVLSEANALFSPVPSWAESDKPLVDCDYTWSPEEAKNSFLERYKDITTSRQLHLFEDTY